ncbi:MAG: MmcQ/YjbR family DNA-binding protein [Bacteroidota bacterium]|nr:MmcQ/YjbR family DNA-binding protein [Bacteroidota bacterium]
MDTVLYLEFVRKTVCRLPEVTEKPCYNTPAFYVGKKLFARMKEDGETLVVQSLEREKWMYKDPDTFFITDHYLNYDYVLVALKTVQPEELEKLLVTAWYNRASNKIRGLTNYTTQK